MLKPLALNLRDHLLIGTFSLLRPETIKSAGPFQSHYQNLLNQLTTGCLFYGVELEIRHSKRAAELLRWI
jgi:hypothetical protein